MKVLNILIIINLIAACWFLYQTAMHIFVFVANKKLGHEVDVKSIRRNGLLASFFGAMAMGGWCTVLPEWLQLLIAGLPLVLLLLYGLWAALLVISSGGKWN
jgi:hypothetical protein